MKQIIFIRQLNNNNKRRDITDKIDKEEITLAFVNTST